MMTQQIRIRSRTALLALAALALLSQSPAQAMAAPPIDGDLAADRSKATPAPTVATVPTAQAAAPGKPRYSPPRR